MNPAAKEYWCDGGCTGNGTDHPHAYGSFTDKGETIWAYKWTDARTNNEAEYMTLQQLLRMLAVPIPPEKGPIIHLDSRLLVEQIMGRWKLKAKHLKELKDDCQKLVREKSVTLVWTPRNEIVEVLGH